MLNKYLGDLKRGITCIWDGQEKLQRLMANEDIQRMVRLTLCTDVGRIEKYTIPDNIVSFIYHSSIHLLPGKMLERKKTVLLENPVSHLQNWETMGNAARKMTSL